MCPTPLVMSPHVLRTSMSPCMAAPLAMLPRMLYSWKASPYVTPEYVTHSLQALMAPGSWGWDLGMLG